MADPKGLTEANIFANEVVRRASVSLSKRKIHDTLELRVAKYRQNAVPLSNN